MTGVTRDTSADAMREAFAPRPAQPEPEPSPAAMRLLWGRREAIVDTLKRCDRALQLAARNSKIAPSERTLNRESRERVIALLAHLSDIEKVAARDDAQRALSGEAAQAPRAPGASAGHQHDGGMRPDAPAPLVSADREHGSGSGG